LLDLDPDGRRPPRQVPGDFTDSAVCGWADDDTALIRNLATPVSVRRVDLSTGASTPAFDIVPPPIGRRGVYTVEVSAGGAAYAYSYGQQLSRLYTLSRGPRR
jgi:hypothetical protein